MALVVGESDLGQPAARTSSLCVADFLVDRIGSAALERERGGGQRTTPPRLYDDGGTEGGRNGPTGRFGWMATITVPIAARGRANLASPRSRKKTDLSIRRDWPIGEKQRCWLLLAVRGEVMCGDVGMMKLAVGRATCCRLRPRRGFTRSRTHVRDNPTTKQQMGSNMTFPPPVSCSYSPSQGWQFLLLSKDSLEKHLVKLRLVEFGTAISRVIPPLRDSRDGCDRRHGGGEHVYWMTICLISPHLLAHGPY